MAAADLTVTPGEEVSIGFFAGLPLTVIWLFRRSP
jgi:hypothetical protein